MSAFLAKHGLEWQNVHQVSVDGCPAMMGRNLGFKGFLGRENADISVDHCTLHRYSLASKTLPDNLKTVFNQAVKVVNFIKAKDLNSRIFKELCKGMGEQYEVLLYHTEVRWLSRSNVVNRLVKNREAVKAFLEEKFQTWPNIFRTISESPSYATLLIYSVHRMKAICPFKE